MGQKITGLLKLQLGIGLCLGLLIVSVAASLIEDTFRECLIGNTQASVSYCFGMGAINKLQSIDNAPEYDLIDGVSFPRDEHQARETLNFGERDPGDLRSIVETLGSVFSRRSMRWDMDFIYPGLLMQVAPSNSPGGVLEFVMNPHREGIATNALKEVGTGRLIARQLLLPFLMGFKFNVSTLIPIIFGLIALAFKKAIFLSKLGLIAGSAIGLATLLFTAQQNQQQQHFPGNYNPGLGAYGGHYGGHFGHGDYNRFASNIVDYDGNTAYRVGNLLQETNSLKQINEEQPVNYAREERTGKRNFAWNDREKTAA